MRIVAVRTLVLGLAALFVAGSAVDASADNGTFAFITDIHFDPFAPTALAQALADTNNDGWGARVAAEGGDFARLHSDTNAPLLVSALKAFGKAAETIDFAIVGGDLLAHEFPFKAGQAFGVDGQSEMARSFAIRTEIFVARSVKAALGNKPLFVTLGNDDAACGDYRIAPGGSFLAATRETVRDLAGADLVADDFDKTYVAGGYYAAKHPTVAKATIIVLNDVLWSANYVNNCGTGGDSVGYGMLAWLRDQLAAAREAGGKVWLVHHIPIGVDPYSTVHSKAAACPDRVTPFLADPFAADYPALLREYADVIAGGLVGHMHYDDYRLVLDNESKGVSVEKVTPAVSPIFGQNPSFNVFTYDRGTGAVTDFATTYLTNLDTATSATADWRTEYTFSSAYGEPDFSPASVEALSRAISTPGAMQDKYRGIYNVGAGSLGAANFSAYSCAIANFDRPSFTACYCPG